MMRLITLGTGLLITTFTVVNASTEFIPSYVTSPTHNRPSATHQDYSHDHDRSYIWPTGKRTRIVRGFDPPAHKWESGHRGVDLEGYTGQIIVAPLDGIVVFSGEIAGTGVVSIEHPDGIRTTYQPIENRIEKGVYIQQGDEIEILLEGHNGQCLHWGALIAKDTYINPLRLVYQRIVLKKY